MSLNILQIMTKDVKVPSFLKSFGLAIFGQGVLLSLCQGYPTSGFLRSGWETLYTPIQDLLYDQLNLDTDIMSGIILLTIPFTVYALFLAGIFWLVGQRRALRAARDI